MQLDLQQVALAHGAGLEARLADVHGLLEARQILFGQIQVRLRQHRRDELRRNVERQRPLVVGHLRRRHRRLVLRRLQAVLPLLAALDEVGQSHVVYCTLINIVVGKCVGRKERQELLVPEQHRIRPQIRGDLLSLILQDRRARRLQRMIVLDRQIDGLVQRHARRRSLRRGLRRTLRRHAHSGEKRETMEHNQKLPIAGPERHIHKCSPA